MFLYRIALYVPLAIGGERVKSSKNSWMNHSNRSDPGDADVDLST